MNTGRQPPLIVHVVYRFDTGGLENGVVNLINSISPEAYRHAVVSLTEVTDFRNRVRHQDVQFYSLNKPPGHSFRLFSRLASLFKELRPAIVHTRNLAALECQVPAWLTGVPVRIHGEHGRDVGDLDGKSTKHRLIRRVYSPFVGRYIALSRDLEAYLVDGVGIRRDRIAQIYNGVDTRKFQPSRNHRSAIPDCPFDPARFWLVGTVGRMQTVKDQQNLARAFVAAIRSVPELRSRVRLILVGDGPQRETCRSILDAAGMADLAWLPGERADVPMVLRGLDCFVLPSLAEGISNTILEAMACGLPVIATRVGGNPELVEQGVTGILVDAADSDALAGAMIKLAVGAAESVGMGQAGRKRVEQLFSLEAMTRAYLDVYDSMTGIETRNTVDVAPHGRA